MKPIVVLDTSIIVHSALAGLDLHEALMEVLESRCRTLPLTHVIDELLNLLRSMSIYRRRVVRRYLETLLKRSMVIHVRVYPGELPDDIALRVAYTLRGYLATDDYELRRRARRLGIPVILFKSKERRLIIIGETP